MRWVMKLGASVLLILTALPAAWWWASRGEPGVEVPLPRAVWTTATLGNAIGGPPAEPIVLRDPDRVSAVADFLEKHRYGWSDRDPKINYETAPTTFVALIGQKAAFELVLRLPGPGLTAYFNKAGDKTLWIQFSEKDEMRLFELFDATTTEQFRVQSRSSSTGP